MFIRSKAKTNILHNPHLRPGRPPAAHRNMAGRRGTSNITYLHPPSTAAPSLPLRLVTSSPPPTLPPPIAMTPGSTPRRARESLHLHRRRNNPSNNTNGNVPPQPPASDPRRTNQRGGQEGAERRRPLTWDEARRRLRRTMEVWKSEERKQQRCIIASSSSSSNETTTRKGGLFATIAGVEDPDMIFLAVPLSASFVALSFALPHSHTSNAYRGMQRGASLLFLISSLVSTWIARRRRRVSRDTDGSIERRRCVSAFLEGMAIRLGGLVQSQRQPVIASPIQDPNPFHVDTIPRKNVEDVYSTYRLVDDYRGQWHRIPSLLLVKGDFIALKVGDTAPAKCVAVEPFMDNGPREVVEAGERLTIDSLSPPAKESLALESTKASTTADTAGVASSLCDSFSSAGTLPTSNMTKTSSKKGGALPPGRSTLTCHSEEMLLCANGVQIFTLLETPLHQFLRKDSIKQHDSTPQVLRQLVATRTALVLFSVVAFLSTVFVLLVRPGGAQNFLQSPNWTLPFLSALVVLPVSTPIFLFWVECFGISRILASVHPLASKRMKPTTAVDGHQKNSERSLGDRSYAENGGIAKPTPQLLCRYIMTTSTYRLFTKSLIKKIASSWNRLWGGQSSSSADRLLSIPPASLYLLEKLGLVTALALVDDELACADSTPQQLLIPSGQGGFTLLDICPVYGDGNSSDEDENDSSIRGSNRINRSSASVDSDESNEETKYRYNHAFQATARAVRTISSYRRKYVSAGRLQRDAHQESCQQNAGAEFGDDDEEVQFEDPEWWKHLPSLKCLGLACLLVEENNTTKSTQMFETQGGHNARHNPSQKVSFDIRHDGGKASSLSAVETSLVDHICCGQKERTHLKLLARCIGFETFPNDHGVRGDLSCFHERRRLHVLSTNLLRQRMQVSMNYRLTNSPPWVYSSM